MASRFLVNSSSLSPKEPSTERSVIKGLGTPLGSIRFPSLGFTGPRYCPQVLRLLPWNTEECGLNADLVASLRQGRSPGARLSPLRFSL